jgi:RNA polymerase-interacting CarD/CdnL/TRCF family regulator
MAKSKKQKSTSRKQKEPKASADALTSSAIQQIANTLGFLAIQTSDYKGKTDTERIFFLSNLGFDRNSIAAIVGTTPATVSTRLSEAKAQLSKKTA